MRRQLGRRRQAARLPAQQVRVDAARARQLRVRAHLRDAPGVHHHYAVRRAHRGQPARVLGFQKLGSACVPTSAMRPASITTMRSAVRTVDSLQGF